MKITVLYIPKDQSDIKFHGGPIFAKVYNDVQEIREGTATVLLKHKNYNSQLDKDQIVEIRVSF